MMLSHRNNLQKVKSQNGNVKWNIVPGQMGPRLAL